LYFFVVDGGDFFGFSRPLLFYKQTDRTTPQIGHKIE
jgi:hypothetical protein